MSAKKQIEISNVRVTLLDSDTHLVGLANIVLDGCFVVNGIRIVQGSNGLFVAMPQQRKPTGEFKDVCHPITSEMRQAIDEAVLEAYNKAVARAERKSKQENSA